MRRESFTFFLGVLVLTGFVSAAGASSCDNWTGQGEYILTVPELGATLATNVPTRLTVVLHNPAVLGVSGSYSVEFECQELGGLPPIDDCGAINYNPKSEPVCQEPGAEITILSGQSRVLGFSICTNATTVVRIQYSNGLSGGAGAVVQGYFTYQTPTVPVTTTLGDTVEFDCIPM